MADTASEKQGKRQAYYPIWMVRSDGQNYDYESILLRDVPGEALQDNDDMDRANREKWEIVLGLFLKDQLAGKDDKKEYKLGALPQGYELRFIRKGTDDTKKDYYLYGHPLGERHKYRSPADFFPHLLWLAGDSDKYTDCSCDFCNKMAEKEKTRRSQSATAAATTTATAAQAPALQKAPTPTATPPLAAPAAKAQPSRAKPVQSQQQPQVTQATQATQAAQAAPPPAPRQYVPPGTTAWSNIFRLGEMVWYKTKAWRIGVIINIVPPEGASSTAPLDENLYQFHIAPLGHVFVAQESLLKAAVDMRPFLTFSVPTTVDPDLEGKAFWEVVWESLTNQINQDPNEKSRASRLAIAGLEASKMAARGVNDSFSMFNQISVGSKPPFIEYRYMGVFFGAEMIYVGDAVRVNYVDPGSAEHNAITTAVMRVSQIRVRYKKDNNPARNIELQGSLYRIARVASSEPASGAVDPVTLGPYFAEEVAGRNAIDRTPGSTWRWVLLQPEAVRGEAEIQGRAYVTHKLMKIVDEANFEDMRAKGQTMDAISCLNKRFHSGSNGTKHLGCITSRQSSFGHSVSEKIMLPGTIKEAFPNPDENPNAY